MSFLTSWWYNTRHGPTAEEYTEAAEREEAEAGRLKAVLAAKQRLLELKQETKRLRKDIERANKLVAAQPPVASSTTHMGDVPVRKARRV